MKQAKDIWDSGFLWDIKSCLIKTTLFFIFLDLKRKQVQEKNGNKIMEIC